MSWNLLNIELDANRYILYLINNQSICRFALVYQLTKPVIKKTMTQSSIPDVGTKVASKDTKPSEDNTTAG